ncbi:hypothetical protein AAFF_G00323570 [Aldrovandia affinis]|uniref:Uncharacterized protein n=1 Tax=Aldrovandia affinis TaxID=143900 RepID=A0AAD7W043_9TELE|nr:hypothetical protein AAFF_G00323570 [Aldrovandia affinis]
MACSDHLFQGDEDILSQVHIGQEQRPIIHSLLLDSLDDLVDDKLERFHSHLKYGLPQGCNPIPRSQLERLSRTKTVEKMLDYYQSKGALRVTLHILRKMDLNEQAESLKRRMKRELHMGVPGHRQTHPSPAGLVPAVTTDIEPCPVPAVSGPDVSFKLRDKLGKRCERIFEGVVRQPAQLSKVYTEVFLIQGRYGSVNNEHEVWNIEAETKKTLSEEVPVKCNRIFQPLPGQEYCVRSVLTKGIAGIGKTVAVQKFILDWAKGGENKDIDLIFPLPFRELKKMEGKKFSLLELIEHYHPEMKACGTVELNSSKVMFIFDGLDECRLPLDFCENETWYDVTKQLSVDVLLTNLIQGNLLPSALLWITSRPAATNKIPLDCIERETELRGFNDQQKEEYFTKRFSNPNQANRIFQHIKSSRSLYIMCHIPVFCLISATVLESLLDKPESGEFPQTLTQMYTHFLHIQMTIKNKKYHNMESNTKNMPQTDKEIIVNLGKLAFEHLEKNNLLFDEEDLKESGIDVNQTSEFSALCTEIIKQELGMYEEKKYCFVHLSIQEYLAALSVHFLYANNKENPLHLDMSRNTNTDGGIKLSVVHRSAVDKALESPNGHLDLFLRFLLGLSLDNQGLLGGLLLQTENSSQSIMETVRYIKQKISKSPSPGRTINLFHCLNELNDHSLVEEIQDYLHSNSLSNQKLSPDQCSALAYVLLMSEKEVEVLDLRMYNSTQAGYRRLLPVLKHSKAALLQYCDLTPDICGLVNLVLQSPTSLLRELDLGYNSKLGDKGGRLLCTVLQTPQCRLQTLGLGHCSLTAGCCDDLASVLCSPHSELRELDLRGNDLLDSGVKALSVGLKDPRCKLQKLGLSGCGVTEGGCAFLASALRSNPSHLRELDLSYNYPGDSGVRELSAGREDPSCKLENLIVDHGGEFRLKPGMRKYGCYLTFDPSTAAENVFLSEGGRRVCRKERKGRDQYTPPVLCTEALNGRCYWEVEWEGGIMDVGMAYAGITTEGSAGPLGEDDQSWILSCDPAVIRAVHDNKTSFRMRHRFQASHRVGVYLDWPTGTLAFYKISSKGPIHLHTFHTTFTQPLYPAFALCQDYSLSLCQLD